jgi:hypothetical protein
MRIILDFWGFTKELWWTGSKYADIEIPVPVDPIIEEPIEILGHLFITRPLKFKYYGIDKNGTYIYKIDTEVSGVYRKGYLNFIE